MTNERKLRRVRARNSQQKEKGHCFAAAFLSPHQNLPVLMRVCHHATEVEHPSVWQELGSECRFSVIQFLI